MTNPATGFADCNYQTQAATIAGAVAGLTALGDPVQIWLTAAGFGAHLSATYDRF